MALFSKPPAKKPMPPAPAARPVPAAPKRPSARDLASLVLGRKQEPGRPVVEPAGGDITVTGASLLEMPSAAAQPAFEVMQANPGLCAVLENAALLYASGQGAPARTLLEQGVASDHDTRLSPLAWLALFDLMQRAGDRNGFDQLALQYVVQFERSAPSWEESGGRALVAKAGPAGGYVAFPGKLTAASATQVDVLKRAIEKGATQTRVDLAQVGGFDDEGARLLAEALAVARRRACPLSIQKADKLRLALAAAIKQGAQAGEGAWMLALELLQWRQERETFEDLAVEYAVAFEQSPPSWEPPPAPPEAPADAASAPAAEEEGTLPADVEMLVWTGVMAGAALAHFTRLADFAQRRAIVPVDMSGVERVDFVCAGSMLNAINRIEAQRKSVQLIGVSPIVRALLLLIGISPRHFVKKAQ
ncbi:MAG: STAS domain-containing protein [Betaproteobacteria bacterium]|nr:STAS domain-containing protein [Betaproteobacteria bacterium]